MSDKQTKPAAAATPATPPAPTPAAATPATPPAPTPAAASKSTTKADISLLRYATCQIGRPEGDVAPHSLFLAASPEQLAELESLEAVREPTEAEIALFEKQQAATAGAAEDVLG